MRSSHLLLLPTYSLAFATFACAGSQPEAAASASDVKTPDAAATEPAVDFAADEQAPAEDTAASKAEEEDSSKPSARSTAIQKVVKDNRQKVRACYDDALKATPNLKGDLVIHFKVDAEGKVAAAELVTARSQITEPKVVDCAIAALKAMTFPAHPEGMDTEVNYPFNFNP